MCLHPRLWWVTVILAVDAVGPAMTSIATELCRGSRVLTSEEIRSDQTAVVMRVSAMVKNRSASRPTYSRS